MFVFAWIVTLFLLVIICIFILNRFELISLKLLWHFYYICTKFKSFIVHLQKPNTALSDNTTLYKYKGKSLLTNKMAVAVWWNIKTTQLMTLFLQIFIKIIEVFNILNFIYIRKKDYRTTKSDEKETYYKLYSTKYYSVHGLYSSSCTQPSIIVSMDFIPTIKFTCSTLSIWSFRLAIPVTLR
jgi:hypothetical protein